MRFPIRPGKVACAGLVAIMMVLPNSIWKGPDAKVAPPAKPTVAKKKQNDSTRRVRFREVLR